MAATEENFIKLLSYSSSMLAKDFSFFARILKTVKNNVM